VGKNHPKIMSKSHFESLTDRERFKGVLLGAGRPHRGAAHPALREDVNHKRVLDWILDAFRDTEVDWLFVGGYQFDKIAAQYPSIAFTINANWKNTRAIASLLKAPLSSELPLFSVYTDIVFGREVVKKLTAKTGDIIVAVDSDYLQRYERRQDADIRNAEKIVVSDGRVILAGPKVEVQQGTTEFVGVALLRKKAIDLLNQLKHSGGADIETMGFPEFLEIACAAGLDIHAEDIRGKWAELNAPQDLARFVLGTKADTLQRLRPLVTRSIIGEQLTVTLREWQADRSAIAESIAAMFGNKLLAIRSSNLKEDSWSTANAGTFDSVINVPGDCPSSTAKAIDSVIQSFGDDNPDHQVLIHAMVQDIALSGVAFTRSLSTGSPYYVVNYDNETERTDTVTGGAGTSLKNAIVAKWGQTVPRDSDRHLPAVITTLQELESLAGHDSLDVEFAVTKAGAVHVLQVRPIAVDHSQWNLSADQIQEVLIEAQSAFRRLQAPQPFVLGQRTVFGIMPDWNPAEIIGTRPRRLALSLYRYLVTDEIWAQQRAEVGYRDVRPHPLMVTFMGHPYIDVRASLNSFIPAGLDEGLAERLVDYYLDYLEAAPHLHDKIEFEVVYTCLTPNFDAESERLRKAGFKPKEITALKDALRQVTATIIENVDDHWGVIGRLEERFSRITGVCEPSLERAACLLEDCRSFGTLPFAHLARTGFVAASLLRAFVQSGLMTKAEEQAFMKSLTTVASKLALDSAAVNSGEMEWDDFCSRYGHLRPGTYEITSPTYLSDAEKFLRPLVVSAPRNKEEPEAFSWSAKTSAAIETAMAEMGIPMEMGALDNFLRRAIEGREFAKFIFSKNLSCALEDIALFGEGVGIGRDELSHVSIGELLRIRSEPVHLTTLSRLKTRVDEGIQEIDFAHSLHLPPLLVGENDFMAFELPSHRPNFVTIQNVSAPVLDLENSPGRDDLKGRIALIPQADPGYDWILGHGISGLITMYGGANSHMAIRAAEFDLPAAIGVGEAMFEKLRHAQMIRLDCGGQRLDAVC